MDMSQVKQLSDQGSSDSAYVGLADFKQAFSSQNPKYFNQLTEGCLVLSELHPKVKSLKIFLKKKIYTHYYQFTEQSLYQKRKKLLICCHIVTKWLRSENTSDQ
ncbi:uncharacterized protein LOC114255117 [Monomorium pharaonis]|uniref:uncharacterized protein LOC114255117 n=1 Tax=Monomorium pharaonis TaxID=307658 RepID=UPI001747D21E|nr:uncharacterized protein LOC114255117 [Monomorium pharaonis]XP_036143777.1 uncharacterized protein LOC114255117 [Monomorium pharaonis]XP_036143779.1 uncharacterized protein LOC114255117 [Monomorium pharaonis]